MENEICRRHLSREGIRCVWGLMSMFVIRHGGSNQKLLMDKKHGSKRIIGIETKVEKQLTYDCEESEAGMQSVKKLTEEEIDEKTQQECDFECRGKTKSKTGMRRCIICSKSSEDINVLIAGDDDHHAEQCPRISQSDAASINDDSEEKFSELIKRLIAQKESETESSKNLVDPVQVLASKEEPFLNIGTQTVVVLKPDLGSSPVTHATDNKAKIGRSGSRFILSRIRRRLKSVVGKNPCNVKHDSDPDPDALSSDISQNSCLREEIETTNHGSEDSKKSMCGIYIAAKKHLSEMLAEGDTNVDSPDKEVPRILGKILDLPEFSTPDNSPRMTSVHDKPKIQQCSSEDYSETLGLSSNKHEETGEEEKTVLDSLSEAISSSIIHQDAYVDEDNSETHDEDEHTQTCSPPISSVKMSECQDNATDVPGKSSPVSVLEPFFTDDDTSPNSSRFSSVETRLQPLCIRFEEPDSPRSEKETRMDDKELALAYIQAVVKSSELNWEELLVRSFYSNQVLEQALMDDIDFCPTNFCTDKKLLFDCINEVLVEFCGHAPWISFTKPAVRFCPDMAEVVQEEVYWHLLPLPSPHTLDQIVKKDLARTGNWMDLHFDTGCIGSETGEVILDELLEEIISSCTDLFQLTKPQCTTS